uniref:Uncharacterized protein n=1 Tax=Chaetoceros debilis TaxID=122233 RepID=A0A7S3PZ36_9STRA|mmetsp:Transcript_19813/g.29999  ORF Transcript_19813/g.29999 Transcript_19813/m.29999 type:complete len:161 (-) Transcript_19813:1105-1587(-)
MFLYTNRSYGSTLTEHCNKDISKALTNANQIMQSSHMVGILVTFVILFCKPSQYKGIGESWIFIKGALLLILIGSTLIGSRSHVRAGHDDFVHSFQNIMVGCRIVLHLLSNAASLYAGTKIIASEEASSDILATGIIAYSILDFFVNMINLGLWMLYVSM